LGGIGSIESIHTEKKAIQAGHLLIQLADQECASVWVVQLEVPFQLEQILQDLDFDSVQRGNPEMERRAQEVINACRALGKDNPIVSIHDVGAGGIIKFLQLPELGWGA
jgi:phosphoribosylformylglycinamidine synthase